MEQEVKKIFRGCPFERSDFATCSECSNYEFCIAKKRYGIRKKRAKKLERFIFISSAFLILMIVVLGVSLLINSLYNEPEMVKRPNDMKVSQNISETTKEVQTAELSADGPSQVYYYEVSEEEKIMMAKLVWEEARGESYEGKVAIAAVVLNRYRFDDNPYDFDNDTISSVILQKNQFASIENVTMEKLESYPECMKAVEDACKGWDPTRATFEDGALYFYNPNLVTGRQKEIREGIKFMAIGNHNFHYDFEKVVEE